MIKLVVCDLDGTLLPRGEEKLSSVVFETISRLAEKGIAFAVASGRSYHELKRLFYPVSDKMYFIASDGGLMVKNEETVYSEPIPKTALISLANSARTQGFPGVMCSAKYLSYYIYDCPKFAKFVHKNLYHHALEATRPQEIKEPIYKVSLYGKRKISLPQGLSGQLSAVYDGRGWQDFVLKGADKAKPIKQLQELLSVMPAETLAFGDNLNDVNMLTAASNSYAVSGAAEEAINAAANVTEDVISTIDRLCFK